MKNTRKKLTRIWLMLQAWLHAFDCALTPAAITYATGAVTCAPATAIVIGAGTVGYLAYRLCSCIAQHHRNKKRSYHHSHKHGHSVRCKKHGSSIHIKADMGPALSYQDIPQPPTPPQAPLQPPSPPPQPQEPEDPRKEFQPEPKEPDREPSEIQLIAAYKAYEQRDALEEAAGTVHTVIKEVPSRIIQAAARAQQLCSRHYTIDSVEESLIEAFNKSEIAIRHGIQLTRNFFTHIQYGDYIETVDRVVGAHTDRALCCMRFALQRQLTGGHGEKIVKVFVEGSKATTKSIMPNVTPQQILEFIQACLKNNTFNFSKDGSRLVIDSQCGIRYILRLGQDGKFDSFYPFTPDLMSNKALIIAKCTFGCFT